MLDSIRSAIDWMTRPLDSVTLPEHRRQSRLLAAIILAVWGFYFVAGIIPQSLGIVPIYPYNELIYLCIFALLPIAYLLSRHGRYQSAAWLWIVTLIVILTTISLGTPDASAPYMLYYLVMVFFFSAVFISLRASFLLWVAIMILFVVIPEISPVMSFKDMPGIFVSSGALFISVLLKHLNLLEQDRQKVLVESQARFQTLFDATPDAIIVTSGQIIQSTNPAFEALLGYTAQDVIGHNLTEFVRSEHHERVIRVLDNGGLDPFEVEALHQDGEAIAVEIRGTSYQFQGKTYQVATLRDVRTRQQVEEQQLALAVERERINLMRSFVADVSHDIRTPMTVIYNTIHMLRRVQSDGRREHYIDRLDTQARHLTDMIDNMLTVGRLDKAAGNLFSMSATDINRVMESLVEAHQPLADNLNLTLTFEAQPELPSVLLDEDEFLRAMRQLIANALRYTPAGGQVWVRTHSETGQVYVTVRDTGIGMKPEDQEHIFEKFYRADKARNTDTGGMGLGLAICKRIIEGHNGIISVESTLGEGSTFTVTLPAENHEPVLCE